MSCLVASSATSAHVLQDRRRRSHMFPRTNLGPDDRKQDVTTAANVIWQLGTSGRSIECRTLLPIRSPSFISKMPVASMYTKSRFLTRFVECSGICICVHLSTTECSGSSGVGLTIEERTAALVMSSTYDGLTRTSSSVRLIMPNMTSSSLPGIEPSHRATNNSDAAFSLRFATRVLVPTFLSEYTRI